MRGVILSAAVLQAQRRISLTTDAGIHHLYERAENRNMNRWKIPAEVETEVRARDTHCVYCTVLFGSRSGKGSFASWEHIVNNASIRTPENIALCCHSCNSSKGTRLLADWLGSNYCVQRGISGESVADVVKRALKSQTRPLSD